MYCYLFLLLVYFLLLFFIITIYFYFCISNYVRFILISTSNKFLAYNNTIYVIRTKQHVLSYFREGNKNMFP